MKLLSLAVACLLPAHGLGREPWIVVEEGAAQPVDPRLVMAMFNGLNEMMEGPAEQVAGRPAPRNPGQKASASLAASATSIAASRTAQGDVELAGAEPASEPDAAEARPGDLGGAQLRRTLAAKRAEVAADEASMRGMQEEIRRLKEQGEASHGKLRGIEERRLATLDARLKQQEERLAKSHAELQRWARARDQLKSSAIQTFRERAKAIEGYRAAKAATEEAQREEMVAERRVRDLREEAARKAEAFKAADVRVKVAEQAEAKQRAKAEREESAVAHMRAIFEGEEARLSSALSSGVERLSRRMKQLQQDEEDAKAGLQAAKDDLAEWSKEMPANMADAGKEHGASRQPEARQHEGAIAEAPVATAQQAAARETFDASDWAWSEEDSSR